MFEFKKAEARESVRMYMMRKKLGFVKPEVKPNDTVAEEEVKLNSFLLTTKQSLSMSVKKAQKALSASQRMKCEVM